MEIIMAQGNPELQKYYEYLKSNGADVPPDYTSFEKTLSDDVSAQKYYTYLKENNFEAPGTYESFSKTLGVGYVKKKGQSERTTSGVSDISSNSKSEQTVPSVEKGNFAGTKGAIVPPDRQRTSGVEGAITPNISLQKNAAKLNIPGITVSVKKDKLAPKPPVYLEGKDITGAKKGFWSNISPLKQSTAGKHNEAYELAKSGKTKESLVIVDELLKKNPKDEYALDLKKYLSVSDKYKKAHKLKNEGDLAGSNGVANEILATNPDDPYANKIKAANATEFITTIPPEMVTPDDIKNIVNLNERAKITNPDDPNAYLMSSYSKIKSISLAPQEEQADMLNSAKRDALAVANMPVTPKLNNSSWQVQSDENNQYNLGLVPKIDAKIQALGYLESIALQTGDKKGYAQAKADREKVRNDKKQIMEDYYATENNKYLKSDQFQTDFFTNAVPPVASAIGVYEAYKGIRDSGEVYDKRYNEVLRETGDEDEAHRKALIDQSLYIGGNVLSGGLALASLIPSPVALGLYEFQLQMKAAETVLPEELVSKVLQPATALAEALGYKKEDFTEGELKGLEIVDFLASIFLFKAIGKGIGVAKGKAEPLMKGKVKEDVAFDIAEKLRKNKPLTKKEVGIFTEAIKDVTNKDVANLMIRKADAISTGKLNKPKVTEETKDAESIGGETIEGSGTEGINGRTEAEVHLRDAEKNGVETETGKETTGGTEQPVEVAVTDEQIVRSLEEILPESGVSYKDFTEKATPEEIGVVADNIRKKVAEGTELNEATRQALDEFTNPEKISNEQPISQTEAVPEQTEAVPEETTKAEETTTENAVLPEVTEDGVTYVRTQVKQGKRGVADVWVEKETGNEVSASHAKGLEMTWKEQNPSKDYSREGIEKGKEKTEVSDTHTNIMNGLQEQIDIATKEGNTKRAEELTGIRNEVSASKNYAKITHEYQALLSKEIIDAHVSKSVDRATGLYSAFDAIERDNIAGGLKEQVYSDLSVEFMKEYERTGNEAFKQKATDIIVEKLGEGARDIARALNTYKNIYATNPNFMSEVISRKVQKEFSEGRITKRTRDKITATMNRMLNEIPKESAKEVAELLTKEHPDIFKSKTGKTIEAKREKVEQRSKAVKDLLEQMKKDKSMFAAYSGIPIPVKLVEYSGKLLVELAKEGYARVDLAVAELRRLIKENFDRELSDEDIKAILSKELDGKKIEEHLSDQLKKQEELISAKAELKEHKQKHGVSLKEQKELDAKAERLEKRISELEKEVKDIEGLITKEKTPTTKTEAPEISDLKKTIRERKKAIKDILDEYFNDRTGEREKNLLQKVKDVFGVDGKRADEIADLLMKRYEKELSVRRQNQLKKQFPFRQKLVPKFLGGKQARINENILKAIESIDPNDPKAAEKYQNAMAEKFGIPDLSKPEVQKKLREYTDKIAKFAGNEFYTNKVMQDMYSYLAHLEREKLVNSGMSLFYANILSGVITHIKNTTWNTLRLAIELPIMEVSKGGKGSIREFRRAFKEGTLSSEDIVKKGSVRRGVSVGETPSSERRQKVFLTRYKKYPGRLLTAADTMLNIPLRVTKTRQIMMLEALEANKKAGSPKTKEQIRAEVNDIFLGTPERQAMAVEKSNAATKKFYGLEQDPLILKKTGKKDAYGNDRYKVERNPEVKLTREQYRSAMLQAFSHMENSRPKEAVTEATDWANTTTLTSKPTGTFGIVANIFETAMSAAPALRPIVMPFVNVPLNVAKFTWENSAVLGWISRLQNAAKGYESAHWLTLGANLETFHKKMGTYREMTPALRHEQFIKTYANIGITAVAATLTNTYYTDESGKRRPIMIVYGEGMGDYGKNRNLEATTGNKIHERSIDFMGIQIPYLNSPFGAYLIPFGAMEDFSLQNKRPVQMDDFVNFSILAGTQMLGFSFEQANTSALTGIVKDITSMQDLAIKGNWDLEATRKRGATLLKSIFVPNLIIQSNTIADAILGKTQKQAKDDAEVLMKGIPFLNDLLDDRLDYQGRPIRQPLECPLASIYFRNQEPENANEIDKLFATNHYIPPTYKNDEIWDAATGEERKMTADERYDLLKVRAKYMTDIVKTAMKGEPVYSVSNDLIQQELGDFELPVYYDKNDNQVYIPQGSDTEFQAFMSKVYNYANKCALLETMGTRKTGETRQEKIDREKSEGQTEGWGK